MRNDPNRTYLGGVQFEVERLGRYEWYWRVFREFQDPSRISTTAILEEIIEHGRCWTQARALRMAEERAEWALQHNRWKLVDGRWSQVVEP